MAELSHGDEFLEASQRLERISELKEKGSLNNDQYEKLNNALVSQLIRLAVSPDAVLEKQMSPNETTLPDAPSYGDFHTQMVERLSKLLVPSEDHATTKSSLIQAVGNMALKRALSGSEAHKIQQIIELVFTPIKPSQSDDKQKILSELSVMVIDLSKICTKIFNNRESSPAAKAIAETVLQSAYDSFEKAQALPSMKQAQEWWQTVFYVDVAGAVQGGSVSLDYNLLFYSLDPQLLAAIGVALGAGFASAIAVGMFNRTESKN